MSSIKTLRVELINILFQIQLNSKWLHTMAETNSTATSLEDRTEVTITFCSLVERSVQDLDSGENPTRDTLAEGLLSLIRPTIDSLERQVSSTLGAQAELKDQICSLQVGLRSLQQQQQCPVELESYVNKLTSTKKRVSLVANILTAAQERLQRVHASCLRETARRRALLEPSPATTPGPEDPARLPK